MATKVLNRSFEVVSGPGPGQYSPDHKVIERPISKKVTFGSKTDFSFVGEKIPGPGAYESAPVLDKNFNSVKIGNSSRNDGLEKYRTVGPGPAAYNTRTERRGRGCGYY